MRYAQIREMDISNGEGLGIALFVQGCPFKCYNCFNPETWDFNGGKEWTEEVENEFMKLAKRPYIKRISILGGEPLTEENLDGVLNLINKFRLLCPNKTIWLYTGYKFIDYDWFTERIELEPHTYIEINGREYYSDADIKRSDIIKLCNVLVDGRYIDSQKNLSLKFCGSENQRLIDIQKSLQKGDIVLWESK